MASKRKKLKTTEVRPLLEANPESQGAEFVTVGWLLCVLTGTVACAGAGLTRFFAQDERQSLVMLSGLLFLAALTIGLISLVLLPFVLRARRVPPPRGLVIFGVVVAILPWGALVVQLVRMSF